MSRSPIHISILLALSTMFAPVRSAQLQVVSKPHSPRAQSTGDSLGLYLSDDGQWAVFTSTANGLVESFPAANEFSLNVYLKNLQSGAIFLLSTNGEGLPASGDSIATSISGDGRFVVFESDAPDLVSVDTMHPQT